MTGEDIGLELVDDRDGHRYVVRVDGQVVGAAYYHRGDDRIVFTHTEVDGAHEGQGLGSVLARHALDAARSEGKRVVPQCPFIARHGEYADLVDPPDS